VGGGLINLYRAFFTDEVILRTNEYEPQIQRLMNAIISEGDTVIDIGANIGVHSILLSNLVGRGGKVLAFEPIPHLIKKLNTNLVLANSRNVAVYPFAVGDKNGQLEINAIDEDDFNSGSSSLVVNENIKLLETHKIKINSIILDDFLLEKNINKIDFVKIDIEGFELNALKGMRSLIAKSKPTMIIEYNCERLEYLNILNQDFKELLDQFYDCYEICKKDYIDESYPLEPFHFDRKIQADLLLISKDHMIGE